VKAYLKKIEVDEKKENDISKYERLKDYVAELRGVLVRHGIRYRETEKDGVRVIELEEPTEVRIRCPPYNMAPVKYVYTIVFEDPAEKQILHERISRVLDDGTTVAIPPYHAIYLPKDWKNLQQVDAVVEADTYGDYVMEDAIAYVSREIENMERDHNITLRLKNKEINELKSVDANAIRDAIIKLFINKDHVLVDKYEYNRIKEEAKEAKDEAEELKEKLKDIKAKYRDLVDFVREKGLQEEFLKFIVEREREEKEEAVKDRFGELFEEDP